MDTKDISKNKGGWDDILQVSVLMPTHNNNRITVKCLESIEKLDYPKGKIEVIISDGVTDDGSLNLVKSKIEEMRREGFLRLVLLENEVDPGPIACMNQCYNHSDENSKYILKLDNDVIFAPDSLAKAVERMETDEKIGVLGGEIFYYDNPTIVAQCAIFLNFYTARNRSVQSPKLITCDYVTGCYALIRKDIITPPFLDERFFNYYDEVDFCLKVKNKGFKVVYSPEVKIWHRISATAKRVPALSLYYRIRNRFLWRHKHANSFQKIIFTLFMLGIMFPVYIFRWNLLWGRGTGKGYVRIFLKAVKDGLANEGGAYDSLTTHGSCA